LSNPIYENLYLSEDATFTTIIITTQTYTSIGVTTESESDMLESGFDDDADYDKSDFSDDGGFSEEGFEEGV
jgi:hypothetical protein